MFRFRPSQFVLASSRLLLTHKLRRELIQIDSGGVCVDRNAIVSVKSSIEYVWVITHFDEFAKWSVRRVICNLYAWAWGNVEKTKLHSKIDQSNWICLLTAAERNNLNCHWLCVEALDFELSHIVLSSHTKVWHLEFSWAFEFAIADWNIQLAAAYVTLIEIDRVQLSVSLAAKVHTM